MNMIISKSRMYNKYSDHQSTLLKDIIHLDHTLRQSNQSINQLGVIASQQRVYIKQYLENMKTRLNTKTRKSLVSSSSYQNESLFGLKHSDKYPYRANIFRKLVDIRVKLCVTYTEISFKIHNFLSSQNYCLSNLFNRIKLKLFGGIR